MKYDTFNQHIDHSHGRDKQPDLEVEEEDEKELTDNIELARKLNNSLIEPDPKFSKRLLNDVKMELREQTARRVGLPVWKVNFRVGWMAYASAIIVVTVFVMWGFGQLNNPDKTAPTQLAVNSPLASSQITRGPQEEEAEESFRELVERAAPGVILADKDVDLSAPIVDITEEPKKEVEKTPPPEQKPVGGTLALGDMPTWPDELGQDLDSLVNLMDDLETFGNDLNSLESDLDSF